MSFLEDLFGSPASDPAEDEAPSVSLESVSSGPPFPRATFTTPPQSQPPAAPVGTPDEAGVLAGRGGDELLTRLQGEIEALRSQVALQQSVLTGVLNPSRPDQGVPGDQPPQPPQPPTQPASYDEVLSYTDPSSESFRYRKSLEAWREDMGRYKQEEAQRAFVNRLANVLSPIVEHQEAQKALIQARQEDQNLMLSLSQVKGISQEAVPHIVAFARSHDLTAEDIAAIYEIHQMRKGGKDRPTLTTLNNAGPSRQPFLMERPPSETNTTPSSASASNFISWLKGEKASAVQF